MKHQKNILIIGILLIVACLTSSAQTRGKIDLFVTEQGDTLFVHDKTYADFVASRFDSLATLRWVNEACQKTVKSCDKTTSEKDSIIFEMDKQVGFLEGEMSIMAQESESYKREIDLLSEAKTNLEEIVNKCDKKMKWARVGTGLSIGGVTLIALPTIIYFATKK